MPLDTSLDKTNDDAFDISIPKECLEAILTRSHINRQPQKLQLGDVILLI